MASGGLFHQIRFILGLVVVVAWGWLVPRVGASSAAGQETLLGVVGRDYVMLGADSSAGSGMALTSSNVDKIVVLVDPGNNISSNDNDNDSIIRQMAIVAAVAGDAASSDRLIETLSAHAAIREYEAGMGCDVECVWDGRIHNNDEDDIANHDAIRHYSPPGLDARSMAHLARGEIASSLRSKSGRLPVCLLIGGMVYDREDNYDDNDKTSVTNTNDNNQEELSSSSASSSFSSRLQSQVQAAAAQYRTTQQNDSAPPSASMKEENVVVGTTTPYLESHDSMHTIGSRNASDHHQDDVIGNGKQPRLFWLDEYGSLQRLQYGAHGHAANFALSVLDQGYRSNLTREEAAELIRSCFRQLRTRYIINSPQPPCIKCVDAHGCQLIQ
uniref:Proteasome subunit beta n=1 Tax=Attheya septentrionalis TaxID=420275 RepID=A0A7S2U879_9STRA|mmetsp:Transcript_14674/g.26626  ORF Transcript_14674/g.26626 Transcript_14674/m.26626 type:complete len:385 (+) Transcript_14674:35-1189(+)